MIECNLNLEAQAFFEGEVELDESYFGGVYKSKYGRGAGGKTAVFGFLKRDGKVFLVVSDSKTKILMPIIASKIKPHSVCLYR